MSAEQNTNEFSSELGEETAEETGEKISRERSTIAFPYVDLDDAIQVARAIYENSGDSGSVSQLAAWLSHSTVESGGFRMKLSGARLFGLARFDRKNVHITPLGRDIVNPATEAEARAKAFLQVPLFRKVFEKYDGYPLPSDSGLESVFVNLGVSDKQKARARQIFHRAAQQAGYYKSGKSRLVAPLSPNTPLPKDGKNPTIEPEARPSSAPADKKHPLISALYKTIPDEGAPWDIESRDRWLATAKSVFDLVYGIF